MMQPFILPSLSDFHREQLSAVAVQTLQAQQCIVQQSGSILHHVMLGHDRFQKFTHYPLSGDRIDYRSGAQYYYHCHREDEQREEHGHIHCFIREMSIPPSMPPLEAANQVAYDVSPMTHLIAIALNCYGQPIRLFTTNRWVCKEQWRDADTLAALTNHFQLEVDKNPEWKPLDVWVQGVVQLFKPQIIWLQQARDARIQQLCDAGADNSVYEAPEYEELSSLSVSLEAQIQWLLDMSAHKKIG